MVVVFFFKFISFRKALKKDMGKYSNSKDKIFGVFSLTVNS